jgi:uncharacterized GH25 family protein
MLKAGDKINIFYDEGDGMVEAHGYKVIEYDNGLLKVYRPGSKTKMAKLMPGADKDSQPEIFNIRSINFFKVEIKS